MSSETLKSKAVGKVWRLTRPGHFEVEEIAIPKPTAEQVLVDVKDRKSTCLNSSHVSESRMPSSA